MVEQSSIVTNVIIEQFNDPSETVLYAEKIKKVSTWGVNQTRILILSEATLYIFEEKGLKKRPKLSRGYPI